MHGHDRNPIDSTYSVDLAEDRLHRSRGARRQLELDEEAMTGRQRTPDAVHQRRPILWALTLGLVVGLTTIGGAQSSAPPGVHLSLQAALDALLTKNLVVMAARYNVDFFRAHRIAAALKPDPTVVFSATQLTVPRVL